MQKQKYINSLLWRGMEKCGVFIPSNFHQAIPIPIPMKVA